jgi:DnaJ domain
MFERNKPHTIEQATLSATLTLTDGTTLTGKLVLPLGRSIIDLLNGPNAFVEFEPFGEAKMLISKACVVKAQQLAVPEAANLNTRLREADGFDPYAILGVPPTALWEDVRHAYIALAKDYHPDRYNTTDLPTEVMAYLAAMARRVNAAYAALELAYAAKRNAPSIRQEPIYTSPAMRG